MENQYQYQKHFTLQEARELLPGMRHFLQKIRKLTLYLKSVGFDIQRGKYCPGFHPDTRDEFPIEFRDLVKLIEEINNSGIQIKSLEQGLIDFPALRSNGDEVFLCWKLDEDEIEFWHYVETGFAGREHISDF